jgi:hypothetical protein
MPNRLGMQPNFLDARARVRFALLTSHARDRRFECGEIGSHGPLTAGDGDPLAAIDSQNAATDDTESEA